jgi:nucleotide-binding universal stress UspA family protein
MFKKILVPLDGSQLAEAALPAAVYIAEKMGATITLVHVIEKDAPHDIHGQSHLADPVAAEAYLKRMATERFPMNLSVKWHVHTARVTDVARGIVEHENELMPDLIVMCTHGRGGMRDILFGNMAQQVINLGVTPVLIINPVGGWHLDAGESATILLPLDYDQKHPHGLQLAAEFSRCCNALLHLLMVIPTRATLKTEAAATGKLLPGSTSLMLNMAAEDAAEYVKQQVAILLQQNIHVTATIEHGEPAKLIQKTADRIHAGLIILGTHGKGGLQAFWSESVATKISNKSTLPLLLVPVKH